MDHTDGSYIIGTDDEDDSNNYVAPNRNGHGITVNFGNSRITVSSRRLANIHRFRQELLPPQPLATTSAASTAAAAAGGTHNATTSGLSHTLSRIANAVRTDTEPRRFTPEERAYAEDLWNSISPEPQLWIWPAPATWTGFAPAMVWSRPAPAGHNGSAHVQGEPLTAWEPTVDCSRMDSTSHLSLQDCVTDYEKLFNGDQRLNGKVDGQLPILSFEQLFFALWAARYHLRPKRNPNNHFEARRPNEHAADFLSDLLKQAHGPIPLVVNRFFDDVVAGTPAPHFSIGDLRITVLRWYESCPASRRYLHDNISGPAVMDLPTLDQYRPDIRKQLDNLFREHFADALDTLRLRAYNVRADLKPMWKIPRGLRQLPIHEQDDPSVWSVRPKRILDNENVILTDSWGLHFAAPGNACTIILSGPPDRALRTMRKYFLSHRVQNVYWFWGRDGMANNGREMTEHWYARLTDHFVGWFPHVRLFIMMPPYVREADHDWSRNIKQGVFAELREFCLNATVICDPLDLKLHDYHEQYVLNGSWQDGYPPWPTDEQDAEGTPSADGLRRRKAYMKEKFGVTLWDYEADDSMDTTQQAAEPDDASSSSSGSGTASPTLQPARLGGTPPPAAGNDPDVELITRLRDMFPNPTYLQARMLDMSRFLNVLYQLDAMPHTPTWLTIYPGLSHVEALNLQGAYKHLVYSAIPEQPDSDADTDFTAEVNPNPGHPPAATAAEGRSPSGQPIDNPRNLGLGHSSAATAAEDRRPPGTSDTTRTRNAPTEHRRGTPRASSRRPSAPRTDILPWLGEGRQGYDW